MITLLLPVSHVTVSGWQHMALLCNTADKEWSDLSCSLWAGFSLTHTCWSAALIFNVTLSKIISMPYVGIPLCVLLPPPFLLFLSSTVYCLLYMWHWSRRRNPVQMFSILVQSFLCFQIAAEQGLWWEEALAGGKVKGRERQTGSSTPSTATVRVEKTEEEKWIEKRRNGEGAEKFLRHEEGREEEQWKHSSRGRPKAPRLPLPSTRRPAPAAVGGGRHSRGLPYVGHQPLTSGQGDATLGWDHCKLHL